MGRSSAIRDQRKRDIKNAIVQSLRQGSNIVDACGVAGISRLTFYNWIEADVHFSQAVNFAKKSRIKIVEDALFKSASEGDVSAQKFFLTNRDPENWKEKAGVVNNGIINAGGENASMPVQINFIGVKPERKDVAEAEVLQSD